MDKISRILLKYFMSGATEHEISELKKWREASSRNDILFHKVGSREFWENAMDPVHQEEIAHEWVLLEKREMNARRRHRLISVCQWAAVVVIPLFFTMLYFNWSEKGEKNDEDLVINESASNAKVRFCLSEGKQSFVCQDTAFKMDEGNVLVVNSNDTISFFRTPTRDITLCEMHRIEVPRGGEYVVRLEDGTMVHLDASSSLVFPQRFEDTKREVELIGHAYFDVQKDSSRPFMVKSGDTHICVLGTEFDLKAYAGQQVMTTLVKGMVEVYNTYSKCKLAPNQQARISVDGSIVVAEVDVYPFIAWKNDRIVFRNESLESIMSVLERWYDVTCVFLSNDLKQKAFTVDIEKYQTIEQVLMAIEETRKVTFVVKGKQVFISD